MEYLVILLSRNRGQVVRLSGSFSRIPVISIDVPILQTVELKDFINRIMFIDNPVILLEGKRKVKPADENKLVSVGRLLAESILQCRFRSGNAPGADDLFIRGVNLVDPSRVELVLPYKGHGKSSGGYNKSFALDEISLASEPETVYQSEALLGKKMVQYYLQGNINKITARAAYLIRDTMKVTGSVSAGLKKADFALFYDDPSDPGKGGTGHTMKACEHCAVPWVDQRVWMGWLDDLGIS